MDIIQLQTDNSVIFNINVQLFTMSPMIIINNFSFQNMWVKYLVQNLSRWQIRAQIFLFFSSFQNKL